MAINDWTDPADWATDSSPWSEFWLGVADSLTLSFSEVAGTVVALLVSDSLGVSLTEAQQSRLASTRTDTLTISVTEVQESLLASSRVDSLGIGLTEGGQDVVSVDWPSNTPITNTWTPRAPLVSTETTL